MSPSPRELTWRAIGAGILFGALFGAANAYIGLRVGMTVATSIPVAIATVALARAFRTELNLAEANLAQTIGSASTSLATGAIFTLPALYLWGHPPSYWQVAALALCGGVLGVAAMVPLRRMLIVEQSDTLPYPEGTACAMVLRSARADSSVARWIGFGLVLGLAARAALGFRLLPGEIGFSVPFIPRAEVGLEVTPALLGVGFILGVRPATVLVSGSALAALVIAPIIAVAGAALGLSAAGGESIVDLSAGELWHQFVRYIGAGAVAAAGLASVARGLPTMVRAVIEVAARARRGHLGDPRARELPGRVVGLLVAGVVVATVAVPDLLGADISVAQRAVAGILVAIFGVLFVAVMARIAGIVGTSSQPTSGITIATLLAVGGVFAALGWNDLPAKMALLSVGAIVAIAASSSGDTAQDLKTGQLVGATPVYQQVGQLIGMATACWAVAATLLFLGATSEFGSPEIPAPQATLIAAIIDGLLTGTLPWGLFGVGAVLAAALALGRVDALAFAIGLYLPLPAMLPIFIGGVVRWYADRRRGADDSGLRPGVLAASGLVAGEGLAGVAVAGLLGAHVVSRPDAPIIDGVPGALGALGLAVALVWFVWRSERSRSPAPRA